MLTYMKEQQSNSFLGWNARHVLYFTFHLIYLFWLSGWLMYSLGECCASCSSRIHDPPSDHLSFSSSVINFFLVFYSLFWLLGPIKFLALPLTFSWFSLSFLSSLPPESYFFSDSDLSFFFLCHSFGFVIFMICVNSFSLSFLWICLFYGLCHTFFFAPLGLVIWVISYFYSCDAYGRRLLLFALDCDDDWGRIDCLWWPDWWLVDDGD